MSDIELCMCCHRVHMLFRNIKHPENCYARYHLHEINKEADNYHCHGMLESYTFIKNKLQEYREGNPDWNRRRL